MNKQQKKKKKHFSEVMAGDGERQARGCEQRHVCTAGEHEWAAEGKQEPIATDPIAGVMTTFSSMSTLM